MLEALRSRGSGPALKSSESGSKEREREREREMRDERRGGRRCLWPCETVGDGGSAKVVERGQHEEH